MPTLRIGCRDGRGRQWLRVLGARCCSTKPRTTTEARHLRVHSRGSCRTLVGYRKNAPGPDRVTVPRQAYCALSYLEVRRVELRLVGWAVALEEPERQERAQQRLLQRHDAEPVDELTRLGRAAGLEQPMD